MESAAVGCGVVVGVGEKRERMRDKGWGSGKGGMEKRHRDNIDRIFFFQAEDGIRDVERSSGLGDVYKRQVLIDMLMPSLIKIPEGSPGALPGALGCLCHPGPSFPVARGKPGVPAVQNEQGRKWDIQLTQSGTRMLFAWDSDVFRT